MAEEHDRLVQVFRKKLIVKGFRLAKSPMPTYRPDVFGERFGSNEVLLEQAVAEAEIEATLFRDHTADQLLMLNEFVLHQKKRRIAVKAYLVIPKGKSVLAQANSLLEAHFPFGTTITILQN